MFSHASEDKDTVTRPLRDALTRLGVTVCLDEAEMRIGHSLRRKIDDGIRSSRFGVVILSDAFRKGWTNHELDGLVTCTVRGEQSLLPIWHDLTAEQVRAFSPSLADKVALSTSQFSIEDISRSDRRGHHRRRLSATELNSRGNRSDSLSASFLSHVRHLRGGRPTCFYAAERARARPGLRSHLLLPANLR